MNYSVPTLLYCIGATPYQNLRQCVFAWRQVILFRTYQ